MAPPHSSFKKPVSVLLQLSSVTIFVDFDTVNVWERFPNQPPTDSLSVLPTVAN